MEFGQFVVALDGKAWEDAEATCASCLDIVIEH